MLPAMSIDIHVYAVPNDDPPGGVGDAQQLSLCEVDARVYRVERTREENIGHFVLPSNVGSLFLIYTIGCAPSLQMTVR